MSKIYGKGADAAIGVLEYPEIVESLKKNLIAAMRSDARSLGLDLATETDVRWIDDVYYRFDPVGDDEGETMVECPKDEATHVRFMLEATYEEMQHG